MKHLLTILLLTMGTTLAFSQKDISESYSGIEKISITTSSSDCILKKSSTTSVLVELEHNYSDAFEPEISKEGNRLVIKETFERNSYSRGSGKWTLTIPDHMDIKINSGSGSLDVKDLDLELDMNTGSGYAELSSVDGEVRFNSGSGDINLSNVRGEFDGNTGSGSIRATDASGDLSFNTGSGDVRLKNITAYVKANTGSGDVRADNIELTGRSSFNTGSGNATVVLKNALKYDISVNSGSGDAEIDFSGNTISGVIEMRANKKNGRIVAPFKFDKEEEIEQGSGKWGQTVVKKTAEIGSNDIHVMVVTGSGTARISK